MQELLLNAGMKDYLALPRKVSGQVEKELTTILFTWENSASFILGKLFETGTYRERNKLSNLAGNDGLCICLHDQ